MGQAQGLFSADGKWWWTGSAWMPARSPDGRAFRWTGTAWRKASGRIGAENLIGITVGLSFVELIWLVVLTAILTTLANDDYEARGRIGTESITDPAGAIWLLASLLILPMVIVIVGGVFGGRYWWVGALAAAWPGALIAFLALVTPGSGRFETIAGMGALVAVTTGAGWLISRIAKERWTLSLDGLHWVQGQKSYPARSSDGQWQWDGGAWRRLEAVLQADHLQAQAAGAQDLHRHQEDRPE